MYINYSKFNKISWGTISDKYQRFPWYRTYKDAKQRCLDKNHKNYKYYGKKGVKFFITLQEIKALWFRDKAYKMKVPSIDRIDTYGNYVLENCRFIELSENCKRPKRKDSLIPAPTFVGL